MAAEFAFDTDLSRNGTDLLGEGAQRVSHSVDGICQGRNLALRFHDELLRKVSVCDSGDDLYDPSDLTRQVGGHEVDAVGEVFPGAGDAFDVRLPSKFPFRAHLFGNARHLGTEGAELVDHRIDGVLELEDFSLCVDGDLLRQVAIRHGSGDQGNVAYLVRQVAGQHVYAVGQIAPGAGGAFHFGLRTELPLRSYFPSDAGHLRRHVRKLLDERVHAGADAVELALEGLAIVPQVHFLREVPLGNGRNDAGYFGGRPSHVTDECIDGLDRDAPRAVGVVK